MAAEAKPGRPGVAAGVIRRSIVLAIPSFELLAEAARACEKGGFDRLWTTEIPGRDAVIRAMHVAGATHTISVGTGIAYAPTRHPVALAGTAHEVNLATHGRITIGLGTAAGDVRRAMGVEWDHPGPRLAEYVELVKAALASRRGLRFHGRFYDVELPGLGLAGAGPLPPPKVFASGANPAALRAVARTADGILLHPLAHSAGYLDDVVLPAVQAGAGSQRPELVAWCVAAVDDDIDQARMRARTRLALYVANVNFVTVLERSGWGQVAERVRAQAQTGVGAPDWVALGQLIPEELLDDLAVCGTPATVGRRIAEISATLSRRGVCELALQLTGIGSPETQLSEIGALGVASSVGVRTS